MIVIILKQILLVEFLKYIKYSIYINHKMIIIIQLYKNKMFILFEKLEIDDMFAVIYLMKKQNH